MGPEPCGCSQFSERAALLVGPDDQPLQRLLDGPHLFGGQLDFAEQAELLSGCGRRLRTVRHALTLPPRWADRVQRPAGMSLHVPSAAVCSGAVAEHRECQPQRVSTARVVSGHQPAGAYRQER